MWRNEECADTDSDRPVANKSFGCPFRLLGLALGLGLSTRLLFYPACRIVLLLLHRRRCTSLQPLLLLQDHLDLVLALLALQGRFELYPLLLTERLQQLFNPSSFPVHTSRWFRDGRLGLVSRSRRGLPRLGFGTLCFPSCFLGNFGFFLPFPLLPLFDLTCV